MGLFFNKEKMLKAATKAAWEAGRMAGREAAEGIMRKGPDLRVAIECEAFCQHCGAHFCTLVKTNRSARELEFTLENMPYFFEEIAGYSFFHKCPDDVFRKGQFKGIVSIKNYER